MHTPSEVGCYVESDDDNDIDGDDD